VELWERAVEEEEEGVAVPGPRPAVVSAPPSPTCPLHHPRRWRAIRRWRRVSARAFLQRFRRVSHPYVLAMHPQRGVLCTPRRALPMSVGVWEMFVYT
jgi:hypothetical protein